MQRTIQLELIREIKGEVLHITLADLASSIEQEQIKPEWITKT